MQQVDSLALGLLAAAVIAGCRRDVGVAGQLLHSDDIRAGVQQVADERAPEVMGRKPLDSGCPGPRLQHLVDGLCGQAPATIAVAHTPEQRPGRLAANGQPVGQRRRRAGDDGQAALLVALAAHQEPPLS